MKILITNDDGVDAPQLLPLIKWCRSLGDVTVVVPKFEQSGKSHSVEIRKPFEIRQIELEPDIIVWTVDSTPADCVRFAVSGLKQSYDLCISGINRGYNLGYDVMYSGTFAAASEAVNKGMKALAVSTSVKYYDQAVFRMTEICRYVLDNRLFDRNPLYNVNIPVEPMGIRITRQGGLSFREEFIPIGNDMYEPGGKPLLADGSDLTLDTDACKQGYISVSPMAVTRMNMAAYEDLKMLNN